MLAAAPLFSKLPGRLQRDLVNRAATRRLLAGERLLTNGAMNRSLFIVLDGVVEVMLPGVDTPHVRLGPGECVGELSLIDGRPVSADVVAHQPTLVLDVRHDDVWSLIDSSAVFARNLLRVLAGRVRHDHAVLAESSGVRKHFERLSMVDGLTALHNRRWFDAVFPGSVARLNEDGRPGALLMADLDWFKRLNDEHGHAAGDEALRGIAGALTAELRPGDLMARYGGEEFAGLIVDATESEAVAVAERLRERAASVLSKGVPRCTLSVGVAVIRAAEPFDALVRRADSALFRAKKSGRNRVSV